ncbi:MAG: SDR family NAD(P)-dependent oxidoreductase [Acidobacteriota bacterium]|nr:SDR family NAD(P)-dependent oxidoreductase [Acidobacteriota bacterium]
MKVLVTGASGFVGREIVAELFDNGIETAQISRQERNFVNTGTFDSGNYFQADIADEDSLKAVEELGKIDAVIHCAGLAHQFKNIDESEFEKVNVLGTKNILDLAVKLNAAHFILISSTAVYGIKKQTANDNLSNGSIDGIDENEVCSPETGYAESKLAAEKAALDICAANNVSLTILRLSPVIGEGNAGNVARLIETVDKKRFVWVGKGKNLKSMIYKKDAARACVKVLKEKRAGIEIFNLAGKPIRMSEFVECIGESLERKIPKINIPPFIFERFFKLNSKIAWIKKIENLARIIEKWLSDDVYSAEKIARAYNFKPETSTTDAVKRQIAFYKLHKGEQKGERIKAEK